MLVKRRPASLSLNSRVNLRMVGTTTTTTIRLATIMVRRDGILTLSNPTMIKEHGQAMEAISRVM